jgi:hypothetical protein
MRHKKGLSFWLFLRDSLFLSIVSDFQASEHRFSFSITVHVSIVLENILSDVRFMTSLLSNLISNHYELVIWKVKGLSKKFLSIPETENYHIIIMITILFWILTSFLLDIPEASIIEIGIFLAS